MTFESMSNIAAQQDYEHALQELLVNPHGPGYNKAVNALMKLYLAGSPGLRSSRSCVLHSEGHLM